MKEAKEMEIIQIEVEDDGRIPNHWKLPLLIYREALDSRDDAVKILHENGWSGEWLGSVHPFHHYHSNTHEVLVVDAGTATLQLGGELGEKVDVSAGDVIILPAGYGHKMIESSDDYQNYGAYPGGVEFDVNYGESDERPEVLDNIKKVPMPEADPVFGEDGPLFNYWND
ncbi:cupin domain-containing protein [Salinicoccus halitifaciens]|uniref:Uncharacterized protein YjlB n=1 Tax=Salinicoccus halitifaciens TaxID=1073415 RepID=A0ABV2EAW7_9STAP|nr:cupin domain-containing protein [Salinicoccus halitifaciens]MCD2137599.1 cupin domain-containing protein [Salinicoccus halitifaciens]